MNQPPEESHHINPRVRAFGKARLDIARRAQTREDWDALWKKPQHEFPFTWGAYWKQCVEYRVSDYAAEVGFFIDILGLPINAFNEYTAMFTGPEQEFYFAVTPTFAGQQPTPPDALRLQFFVGDIFAVAEELERRGILFEQPPQPVAEGSNYYVGTFRTPHGICIDLCGIVDDASYSAEEDQTGEANAGEDLAAEEPEEIEPFPHEEPGVIPPSGRDLDDVFVEVPDQPSPPTVRPNSLRQPAPQSPNRPANQGQPSRHDRFQPDAPGPAQSHPNAPGHQPSPPPAIEPTYEPLDDSSPGQAPGQSPAQPPAQPRTYRAISFNEDR